MSDEQERQPLRTSVKFLIAGGIFAVIWGLWLIFNAVIQIYAIVSFENCEKAFDTLDAVVNVGETVKSRSVHSGKHSRYHYNVTIYEGSYNGAIDRYEVRSKNNTEDYSGLSDAVFLSGTVHWHGNDLYFSKLSVKNFPDYDEDNAYDPKDVGIAAISDVFLGEIGFLEDIIPKICTFAIFICFGFGFTFRKKGQ